MEFLNFWCKCRKSAKGKTPKEGTGRKGAGRKGGQRETTKHGIHFISLMESVMDATANGVW